MLLRVQHALSTRMGAASIEPTPNSWSVHSLPVSPTSKLTCATAALECRSGTHARRRTLTVQYRAARREQTLQARLGVAWEILRQLRFNDSGSTGYFFAYDTRGVNVMHGVNQSLEGKNLWDFQDPNGTFLIRELVKAARSVARSCALSTRPARVSTTRCCSASARPELN